MSSFVIISNCNIYKILFSIFKIDRDYKDVVPQDRQVCGNGEPSISTACAIHSEHLKLINCVDNMQDTRRQVKDSCFSCLVNAML